MWWRQGFFFPLLTPGSEEEEDVKPASVGGRESEKLLEQIKNILARAVSPKGKENKRRTGEKSAAEPPQTLERLEASGVPQRRRRNFAPKNFAQL